MSFSSVWVTGIYLLMICAVSMSIFAVTAGLLFYFRICCFSYQLVWYNKTAITMLQGVTKDLCVKLYLSSVCLTRSFYQNSRWLIAFMSCNWFHWQEYVYMHLSFTQHLFRICNNYPRQKVAFHLSFLLRLVFCSVMLCNVIFC